MANISGIGSRHKIFLSPAGGAGGGGNWQKGGKLLSARLSLAQITQAANLSLINISRTISEYKPLEKFPLLQSAADLMLEYHGNSYFPDGEPFVFHHIGFAGLLAELKMDETIIAAGLVHNVPVYRIEQNLDAEVAAIVQRKANLEKFSYDPAKGEEQRRFCFNAMILAEKDLNIHLLVAADALHTLKSSIKKEAASIRQEYALNALHVIAPFLRYLGYRKEAEELEDTAFFFIEPKNHEACVELMKQKAPHVETVRTLKRAIVEDVGKANIPVSYSLRPKRAFSIHRKILKLGGKEWGYDKVRDLVGMRFITNTEANCYEIEKAAKKIMAQHGWKEAPQLYKDHIKNPKENGYQSIHLKFVKDGKYTEVQIRTEEMHINAEFGVASHLLYKDPDLKAPVIGVADDAIKKFRAKRVELKDQELHYIFEADGRITEIKGAPKDPSGGK